MSEKISNLEITKNKKKRVIAEDDIDIPHFKTKIDLSDEDKDRIFKEIDAEYQEIKKERDEMRLDQKLDSLDKQYDGEMRQIANMQFNISRKTTAVKINAVERSLSEALFDGDHIFTVTPRPEFEGKSDEARLITEKQEDFLDYKIDEVIPLEEELSKVIHSTVLKYGGILKITQKYKTKKRKTNETYEGRWEPVLDEVGRPVIDKNTRQPALKNEGLEQFIKAYPEAQKEYPGYIKALAEEKKLDLVIEYDECVYDDPLPQSIDMKNFFVRKNVNGIDGLRDTYLVMERKEFTYWQLLQEVKEERLYDIDKLIESDEKDDRGKNKKIENYANQTYVLYECVFHTKFDDGKKEKLEEGEEQSDIGDYMRCVFHVSLDKKSIHGGDYYPYWGVDTYYIPFYIKDKEAIFYRKGLGDDIRDIHLAQNLLLSLSLESAYINGLVTPIVMEGSTVASQFLEKSWNTGDPLIIQSKNDIPDFLNRHLRPPDIGSLMNLGMSLSQEAGDVTGASEAFATGKADPIDPSAPAQKTRDLLRQSGINMRDYIKVFGRSFNEIGNILMQMYYQRNQKTYKFRNMRRGEKEFKEISRSEMAAKVNYQTQALAFDADKLNAKREDIALMQLLNDEPLFRGNEEAVYYALRMVVTNWSQKWKNNRDKILMSPQEFRMRRAQMAMVGVKAYIERMAAQAQMAGEKPVVNPKDLVASVDQYLREMATPPSKEEMKQRQKEGI